MVAVVDMTKVEKEKVLHQVKHNLEKLGLFMQVIMEAPPQQLLDGNLRQVGVVLTK
jgi:ABC-type proline/glycine betaine transport system ATPase subunit